MTVLICLLYLDTLLSSHALVLLPLACEPLEYLRGRFSSEQKQQDRVDKSSRTAYQSHPFEKVKTLRMFYSVWVIYRIFRVMFCRFLNCLCSSSMKFWTFCSPTLVSGFLCWESMRCLRLWFRPWMCVLRYCETFETNQHNFCMICLQCSQWT